jgi:hypothetical protein
MTTKVCSSNASIVIVLGNLLWIPAVCEWVYVKKQQKKDQGLLSTSRRRLARH